MTDNPNQPIRQPQAGPRRLTRRTGDKMLGGVCGGVADYFGIDATLVRVLAVVGLVLGMGSLAVVYVILWLLLPED